jgi:adenylate kinase/ribonuclease R
MSNLFIKEDLIKRLMVQTQRSREQVINMIIKARQEKFLKEKRSRMEKEYQDNIFNQPYDSSVSWADIIDDPPFNPSIIELTEEELSDISNSIQSKYNSTKRSSTFSNRSYSKPPPIFIPKPPTYETSNLDDIPEPNLDFKQKTVNKELVKEKFYDILRENKYIFVNNYLDPVKKIMILLEGTFGRDLSEYSTFINELIEKEKPAPEPEYTEEPSIITFSKKSKKSTVNESLDSDDTTETIEIDKFSAKKSKTKTPSKLKSPISEEPSETEEETEQTEETEEETEEIDFTKYKKDINAILTESDLDTISAKKIRKQLEKDYDIDLSNVKKELDEYIIMLFHEFVEKKNSPKKVSDKKRSSTKKRSSKKDSTKKRSSKKRSSKKLASVKKRSTKKRSTKKRSKKRASKKARSTKRSIKKSASKKRSTKKARSTKKRSSKKRSTKKRSSKKARSTKKRSDKKRSTKKRSSKKARSSKKRSTKKRSTKKRSSKKARSTKKRSTKKRSKKRSSKKRSTKKRSSKKARSTKKRSSKKRSTKKRSTKKRSTKKRSTKK